MEFKGIWTSEVRFLEFMPFDGNSWTANRLVPQERKTRDRAVKKWLRLR